MNALLDQVAFTYPLWLYVIPACLLVLAVFLWRWPQGLAPLSVFVTNMAHRVYRHTEARQLHALQERGTGPAANRQRLLRFVSYGVLLSLFCIALAQPYRLGKRLPEPQRHRDILFLVDTSLSMILRDYIVAGQRTDRMSMLKDVLRHFIEALHGNRIGLIVFSEQPYYYVPLTNDYALLQFQLQRLQAATLTGRSSDISRALLYSLRWTQDGADTKDAVKPVLVLITDANRTARHIDPRAAAAFIAQHQLRVHTIAIGAGSYAGAEQGLPTLVYHPASFYLLENIAKAGHGEFFWAKDQDSLQQALHAINQSEMRKVTSEPEFIRHPLYHWPLLGALLWLSGWQLLVLLRRAH
jgi:Ca-activated chloride channel family protein